MKNKEAPRIPALVQWVKNPTIVAWIIAAVWIPSLAWEIPYALGVYTHTHKHIKRLQKTPLPLPP